MTDQLTDPPVLLDPALVDPPLKVPAPDLRFRALDDPVGDVFFATAEANWATALAVAVSGEPEEVLAAYDRPDLPAWTRPPSLAAWIEEPLGRYVWGGGQQVLHDLDNATDACALDQLTHGEGVHFIHFARELEGNVPVHVDLCPACMGV